jgi:hypothetical protein
MHPVYAQVDINTEWRLATRFPTLGKLVSGLFPTILLVAGIIFFVLTIVAGFRLLSAAGKSDPHELEKWRQVLFSGLIGLLIIFASYWILQLINFVTGGLLNGLLGG